jgi:hypothetical protein
MIYYLNIDSDNKIVGIVNSDHWFIPMNDENMDYQAYLAWVAEGNTATEYSPE